MRSFYGNAKRTLLDVAISCWNPEWSGRRGSAWVKNWMEENCRLLEINDTMPSALNDFNTFNAQFHGLAGRKPRGK